MKKYSMPITLLTIEGTSGTNLMTSHTQLSENAVGIEQKTLKIKFCLIKSTLLMKKPE